MVSCMTVWSSLSNSPRCFSRTRMLKLKIRRLGDSYQLRKSTVQSVVVKTNQASLKQAPIIRGIVLIVDIKNNWPKISWIQPAAKITAAAISKSLISSKMISQRTSCPNTKELNQTFTEVEVALILLSKYTRQTTSMRQWRLTRHWFTGTICLKNRTNSYSRQLRVTVSRSSFLASLIKEMLAGLWHRRITQKRT